MKKNPDKKKKQDLGIFYTPQEVIRFIFNILNTWKTKEDSETGRWNSRKHFPSVIDPAVGEGAFLKIACEMDFTQPEWIFGLDVDENAVKKWKEINLLKEFGGKNKDLEAHFFHQNGLEPIRWNQHKGKYKYKLKQIDIQNQQFDVVVGNPPYGGLGVYEDMKLLQESISGSEKTQHIKTQVLDTLFGEQEVRQMKVTETTHKKINISQDRLIELKELSKALILYEIWKHPKLWVHRVEHNININGVNFNLKEVLDQKEIERLKSFPIEILFLERFIQLAKPGGWIAVIIPDGILANSNSHYVREFVANKTKVEAIISLPRDTFKNAGTNAKTSILFLRKFKEKEKLDLNYRVFLASLKKIKIENFQVLTNSYKKFYNDRQL